MSQQHRVTIEDGHGFGQLPFFRAFCHTCFWRGPKVRFRHTAERHGRKHIEAMAAQPQLVIS